MAKLFLLVLTLAPILTFGQKVTEDDIQKIMALSQEGQNNIALSKIDSLKKIVTDKDENYPMLIMASAEINTNTFNYEVAIRDVEELIRFFPEQEGDYQSNIARFKKYLGDFDGAITAYKRIFELNPNENMELVNMASVYNSAGKYQDAIQILNSNPSTDSLSLSLGYFHYALAYFNLDKFDSAKFNIDKFLTTNYAANDFLAYKMVAQIYAALGDKKKSCEFITKATDILVTSKQEEGLNNQPQKIKNYYFIKEALKDINNIKKLQTQFCD